MSLNVLVFFEFLVGCYYSRLLWDEDSDMEWAAMKGQGTSCNYTPDIIQQLKSADGLSQVVWNNWDLLNVQISPTN